jgi:hypothetical protein
VLTPGYGIQLDSYNVYIPPAVAAAVGLDGGVDDSLRHARVVAARTGCPTSSSLHRRKGWVTTHQALASYGSYNWSDSTNLLVPLYRAPCLEVQPGGAAVVAGFGGVHLAEAQLVCCLRRRRGRRRFGCVRGEAREERE